MSYRCDVCTLNVPSGLPLRRHAIYRPDGSIAREVPVCSRCQHILDSGQATLEVLHRTYHAPAPLVAAVEQSKRVAESLARRPSALKR